MNVKVKSEYLKAIRNKYFKTTKKEKSKNLRLKFQRTTPKALN